MKLSTPHQARTAFTALALTGALALATAGGSLHAATSAAKATAAAAAAPSPAAAARSQLWSASRGTVGVRWNRELAADLGLVLGAAQSRHAQLSGNQHELFDLQPAGSLDFDVRNGNLRQFISGGLQVRGGYAISSPAGRIDLTDFKLIPRQGGVPILDLVGADGRALFYIDRLMYELIDGRQRLAVRTMDLRLSPELATALGHPEAAGWAVADLEMTTNIVRQGAGAVQDAVPKWHGTAVPGVPGAVYLADLFMSDMTFQYSRCDTCTGVGGTGRVVFTPASTLAQQRQQRQHRAHRGRRPAGHQQPRCTRPTSPGIRSSPATLRRTTTTSTRT